MQVLYTASAQATGDGRDGHVRTSDGGLDLDLAIPKEMGGAGGATNPEQLFAAGYAACFHSALRLVARKARADVSNSVVEAEVGIGPNGSGGYGLAVTLVVDLPAVERSAAQQLVEAAHQVCPYSNATRGNIEVALTVRDAR
jgi:Ohr subfamily peroxiredoxin